MAVSVAGPTAIPFTVNVPVVDPPRIVMVAGETVAILGVPLLRLTVRAVVGAGAA